MIHCNRTSMMVAFLGCSLGASAMLFAADAVAPDSDSMFGAPGQAATASDLLQQGLAQYESGDLAQARKTLERVDAAQLETKEERVELTRILQDIDRKGMQATDPDALLTQAADAVKAGDLTAASNFYRQVSENAQASDAQKQLAQARLAHIRRQMTPADERAARQSLNQAITDIQNNSLDSAQMRLTSIKQSGVDLGWFDNQRLDRALAVVDERRAQIAQMTPPPAPVETVTEAPEAPTTPTSPAAPAQPAAEPTQPAQPVEVAQAPEAPAQPEAPAAPATPAVDTTPDVLAQAISLAAQEKIALARAAEQDNNFRLAVQRYEEALAIQPSNADARTGLAGAQVRAQQDAGVSAPSILAQQTQGMDVAAQAAVAEYRQLINLADTNRKALNYAAAVDAAQQARLILDNNARYLPAAQYRQLREEAVQLAASINDERIRFEEAEKQRLAAAQEAQARSTAELAISKQDAEVQNLLRRARALQKEQSYERSLQLINQALFLDPNNYAAQAMKDIIEDTIILVRSHNVLRQKAVNSAIHRVENAEAAIPPTELLQYPPDWPQLTLTRQKSLGQADGESDANRLVAQKLREPIPAEFNANQLETAINFIRLITGVNILVNWSAMQLVGVERDTPISLQLSNVPASQALKYILQDASSASGTTTNPVTYAIFDGLVQISTEEDLKSTTTYARVYDIRDLLIQVPNFEDAPSFELGSVLKSSSSVGGAGGGAAPSGGSLFGDTGGDSEDEDLDREQLITDITDLIQSTVGKPEDWPNAGGLLSSITELNGNLIIRTTPGNHRETLELLGQLRETRAMQISIEARFLLVDRQFVNDFGVDFDMTINNIGSNWGPITIAQNSFPATDIASALTGGNPALALGASFMDDVEVNLMIRATQADQRSVQLTAPRLTLFNGQRAYVMISTQTTFVSDLEPVPDTGGFNPTVSVVNEGVQLDVEGTISADRRYVTMTVRPSLARLVDLVSVPFTSSEAVAGNANNNNNNNGGGIIVSQGTLQLPILEVNTIRTTVSVPDKGTILLGGQRIVNEREIEIGVPVLSKIPVLNRLFTNRSIDKLDRTLLILIKPTIIIQAEEEENLFPGLNANPEQFNVGRSFQ